MKRRLHEWLCKALIELSQDCELQALMHSAYKIDDMLHLSSLIEMVRTKDVRQIPLDILVDRIMVNASVWQMVYKKMLRYESEECQEQSESEVTL